MRLGNLKPEWLMLGWRDTSGGYVLLASRELDQAQFDWVAAQYEYASWAEFCAPGAFRPRWHVDVEGTQKYVIVKAASYAECLADLLFKHGWRADNPLEPDALPTHDPIVGHLAARAAERKEIGP